MRHPPFLIVNSVADEKSKRVHRGTFVVSCGCDTDGLLANEAAARQAVDARQRQRIFRERLSFRQTSLHLRMKRGQKMSNFT